VDLVGVDAVPVEVPNRLHLVDRAVELHLVALHHLLNRRADVAQAHVHPSLADAGVGRLLHGSDQRVIPGGGF
jgi:hypothetical protein